MGRGWEFQDPSLASIAILGSGVDAVSLYYADAFNLAYLLRQLLVFSSFGS